jgi:hypothetical protein
VGGFTFTDREFREKGNIPRSPPDRIVDVVAEHIRICATAG